MSIITEKLDDLVTVAGAVNFPEKFHIVCKELVVSEEFQWDNADSLTTLYEWMHKCISICPVTVLSNTECWFSTVLRGIIHSSPAVHNETLKLLQSLVESYGKHRDSFPNPLIFSDESFSLLSFQVATKLQLMCGGGPKDKSKETSTGLLQVSTATIVMGISIWRCLIRLVGKNLHVKYSTLNALLRCMESAFKIESARKDAFAGWTDLVYSFALAPDVIIHPKRIKLVIQALKNVSTTSIDASIERFRCWWTLIEQIDATGHWPSLGDSVCLSLMRFIVGGRLVTLNVSDGDINSVFRTEITQTNVHLKQLYLDKEMVSELLPTNMPRLDGLCKLIGSVLSNFICQDRSLVLAFPPPCDNLLPMKNGSFALGMLMMKKMDVARLVYQCFRIYIAISRTITEGQNVEFIYNFWHCVTKCLFEISDQKQFIGNLQLNLVNVRYFVRENVDLPIEYVLKVCETIAQDAVGKVEQLQYAIKLKDVPETCVSLFLWNVFVSALDVRQNTAFNDETKTNELIKPNLFVTYLLDSMFREHPSRHIQYGTSFFTNLLTISHRLPVSELTKIWLLFVKKIGTIPDNLWSNEESNSEHQLSHTQLFKDLICFPLTLTTGWTTVSNIFDNCLLDWCNSFRLLISMLQRSCCYLSECENAELTFNCVVEQLCTTILKCLKKGNEGCEIRSDINILICVLCDSLLKYANVKTVLQNDSGMHFNIPNKQFHPLRELTPLFELISHCLLAFNLVPPYADEKDRELLHKTLDDLLVSLTDVITKIQSGCAVVSFTEFMAKPFALLLTSGDTRHESLYHKGFAKKTENCVSKLLTSLTGQFGGPYETGLLEIITPLLVSGFNNSKRQLKHEVYKFWQESFSKAKHLEYSKELMCVLVPLVDKSTLVCPGLRRQDHSRRSDLQSSLSDATAPVIDENDQLKILSDITSTGTTPAVSVNGTGATTNQSPKPAMLTRVKHKSDPSGLMEYADAASRNQSLTEPVSVDCAFAMNNLEIESVSPETPVQPSVSMLTGHHKVYLIEKSDKLLKTPEKAPDPFEDSPVATTPEFGLKIKLDVKSIVNSKSRKRKNNSPKQYKPTSTASPSSPPPHKAAKPKSQIPQKSVSQISEVAESPDPVDVNIGHVDSENERNAISSLTVETVESTSVSKPIKGTPNRQHNTVSQVVMLSPDDGFLAACKSPSELQSQLKSSMKEWRSRTDDWVVSVDDIRLLQKSNLVKLPPNTSFDKLSDDNVVSDVLSTLVMSIKSPTKTPTTPSRKRRTSKGSKASLATPDPVSSSTSTTPSSSLVAAKRDDDFVVASSSEPNDYLTGQEAHDESLLATQDLYRMMQVSTGSPESTTPTSQLRRSTSISLSSSATKQQRITDHFPPSSSSSSSATPDVTQTPPKSMELDLTMDESSVQFVDDMGPPLGKLSFSTDGLQRMKPVENIPSIELNETEEVNSAASSSTTATTVWSYGSSAIRHSMTSLVNSCNDISTAVDEQKEQLNDVEPLISPVHSSDNVDVVPSSSDADITTSTTMAVGISAKEVVEEEQEWNNVFDEVSSLNNDENNGLKQTQQQQQQPRRSILKSTADQGGTCCSLTEVRPFPSTPRLPLVDDSVPSVVEQTSKQLTNFDTTTTIQPPDSSTGSLIKYSSAHLQSSSLPDDIVNRTPDNSSEQRTKIIDRIVMSEPPPAKRVRFAPEVDDHKKRQGRVSLSAKIKRRSLKSNSKRKGVSPKRSLDMNVMNETIDNVVFAQMGGRSSSINTGSSSMIQQPLDKSPPSDPEQETTSPAAGSSSSSNSLNNVVCSLQSQMEATDPFYQPLIDCQLSIDRMLPSLTSSSMTRSLNMVLSSRNIKTVGDLARLSELQLSQLPIRSPKLDTVSLALEAIWMQQKKLKLDAANRELMQADVQVRPPVVNDNDTVTPTPPLASVDDALVALEEGCSPATISAVNEREEDHNEQLIRALTDARRALARYSETLGLVGPGSGSTNTMSTTVVQHMVNFNADFAQVLSNCYRHCQ